MKNEYIQIRVNSELKEKIKEKAKEEYKTISGYIIDLITKDLQKK